MDYRGRHYINIHAKKYARDVCQQARVWYRIIIRLVPRAESWRGSVRDHPPVRTRSNEAVTAKIILTFLSVSTSVFHAWPTNETRSRGNWVAKSTGMKREKTDIVSYIIWILNRTCFRYHILFNILFKRITNFFFFLYLINPLSRWF